MEYKRMGNVIYLRVDKDEEIQKMVKHVCKKENVLGYFRGIGACGKVSLGTYLKETKAYHIHEVTGSIEIVSLTGNVTLEKDGDLRVHSHGVFSCLDEDNIVKVTGGHIFEAIVSFTGEIIINIIDEEITRKHNSELGIDVWDLENNG